MRSGTVRVYAITNSRTVPEMSGLRVIRVGTLAALVIGTRRPASPTPASLRQYHRTIAAIADALPAMLPVQFGTLMSETELAMVLQVRETSLAATLRRVRGRVQMTLRLASLPTSRAGASDSPAAKPARANSGRTYLRALAARERDVPGFDTVRTALRPWIEDERIERRANVVSVYHLIPRRSSAAYARAAAKSFAEAGLRGVVSGPFPPYAFSAW